VFSFILHKLCTNLLESLFVLSRDHRNPLRGWLHLKGSKWVESRCLEQECCWIQQETWICHIQQDSNSGGEGIENGLQDVERG
jgi:hypothetical protein